MDPAHYVRVIRLRLRVIILCVLVGAAVGTVFTIFESQVEGEEVAYWLANHKLVVTVEAAEDGRFPNLLQTALLLTGGDVPEAVAAEFDTDETQLTRRIRTVADPEVAVIEISAVGTDPDVAGELADAFANELVGFLGARDLAAWQEQVDRAQADADAMSLRLDDMGDRARLIEADIAEQEALAASLTVPAEPSDSVEVDDELSAEQRQSLLDAEQAQAEAAVAEAVLTLREDRRALEIERSSRTGLYEDALAAVDSLQRRPPAALMETLDIIPPYTINKSTYDRRLRQGRQGENNFSARSVDDSASTGLRLRQTVSNPVVRTILGAVAGLLIGIGGALLHLRLDPRLRTKADVEQAFGLPVLAEIPKFSSRDVKPFELHAVTRSLSAVTEAYRVVRSALLFAVATVDVPFVLNGNGNGNGNGSNGRTVDQTDADVDLTVPDGDPDQDVRVIMVTSPGPSEGKTTTTANLAVVLAESGYEVLVVNCDYRLPKLHRFFDQPHACRRTLDTGVEGVTLVAEVIDASVTNPTTVVEAQRVLIEKARSHYDVVLVDTAPLLATNDSLALLPVVDMVVLVASEGTTDRVAATEAVDLLRRRRANVVGVVMTGSSGFGRSRYYYKYRYGNYYNRASEQPDTLTDFDLGPRSRRRDRAARRSARAAVSAN